MQTIKRQLEDSMYKNIDFIDDGYPAITAEEAKKRVSETVEDYRANVVKNFSEFNDEYWDDLNSIIDNYSPKTS